MSVKKSLSSWYSVGHCSIIQRSTSCKLLNQRFFSKKGVADWTSSQSSVEIIFHHSQYKCQFMLRFILLEFRTYKKCRNEQFVFRIIKTKNYLLSLKWPLNEMY